MRLLSVVLMISKNSLFIRVAPALDAACRACGSYLATPVTAREMRRRPCLLSLISESPAFESNTPRHGKPGGDYRKFGRTAKDRASASAPVSVRRMSKCCSPSTQPPLADGWDRPPDARLRPARAMRCGRLPCSPRVPSLAWEKIGHVRFCRDEAISQGPRTTQSPIVLRRILAK